MRLLVAGIVTNQPTFGLDQVTALQGTFGSYPLWQYVASLIWIVAAFVTASVVDWLMTRILRRLTAKTKTDFDDKLLEILHKPVRLTVLLLMMNAGVNMFAWPDWAEKAMSVIFILAVAATVTYLAVRLMDLVMQFVEGKFFADDTQLAKMLLPVLSKSLKVFVTIVALLTTAQHLGMPITSVLAGLGVGGIAVALAAQNTLANVFGSITILTDRPFRVGDRVVIESYDGMVETIGLRSTRIRLLDGSLVVIPNKTVADSSIKNISLRPSIRETFSISLTYDTSADRVREAAQMLREIFKAHPNTLDYIVFWKTYAAASLDIFVVYWCKTTDYRVFAQSLEEINLEVKRRFDDAKFEFAFPTQTLYLRKENA